MKFSKSSTLLKVSGIGVVLAFLMLVFYEFRGPGAEPPADDWFVVDEESERVILQGDLALTSEEAVGGLTLDDLAKLATDSGPAALATAGRTLRLKQGTRVMVVETDGNAALVRGIDGPATGSEYWIEKTSLEKKDIIRGSDSLRVKVPVIVKGGID